VPAEIELKLALDPAVVPRAAEIARHPAVVAAKRGRLRSARVASTYYDTPDLALEKARVALRLRRDGARIVQTVKGPPLGDAGGALHAHDEHEWRLARPRLDLERLARTPWRKLFGRALEQGLAPVFTTDVIRNSLPLAFPDGSTATLAIDVGTIRTRRGAARRVPIAEIEIEVGEGSAAAAFDLALALIDDWPLTVAPLSKAARGYALARGLPGRSHAPVHAGRAAFAPDAPAEDALRAIVRECLRQVSGNAEGLLADADPEWTHPMRVGTRRLRSCLSLVASLAGRGSVAPVVAEVRWLASVLGAARDWDVLAIETLPPLAAALAQDPATAAGWKRLARAVAAHRRTARAAAREAVRSLRFQRLLLATGAACARPGFGGTSDRTVTARAFAERILERRHHGLLERGAALEHGTADERHAVRIAAKKLRYAAEFFSPPDPPKRNRAYLKALAQLQDALGRWNDAVIATRLTAGLAEKSDHATVGAVRGFAAARAAALSPEIATAWQRFARAEPFWGRA
jgi:inorganic triphosphatase YgiF